VSKKAPPIDRTRQDKLLERIQKRYQQLDEILADLEAKLAERDDENFARDSERPRKPR
jgi:hypothetical protein